MHRFSTSKKRTSNPSPDHSSLPASQPATQNTETIFQTLQKNPHSPIRPQTVFDLQRLVGNAQTSRMLAQQPVPAEARGSDHIQREPTPTHGKNEYIDENLPGITLVLMLASAGNERSYFQVKGVDVFLSYDNTSEEYQLHQTNEPLLPDAVVNAMAEGDIAALAPTQTRRREQADREQINNANFPYDEALVDNTQAEKPAASQGDDFGLQITKSSFVADAVNYWKQNKQNTLDAYVQHLWKLCSQSLKMPCEIAIGNLGNTNEMGNFQPESWKLAFNANVQILNGVKMLNQLSRNAAAEIADTIYHEMRHCEQYFTVAQMLAKENTALDAESIARQVGIPLNVATTAIKTAADVNELKGDQLKTVKGWQPFFGEGNLVTYKNLVNKSLFYVTDLLSKIGNALGKASHQTLSLRPEILSFISDDANAKHLETVKQNDVLKQHLLNNPKNAFENELNRQSSLPPENMGLVVFHTKKIFQLARIIDEQAWYNCYMTKDENGMEKLIYLYCELHSALENAYAAHPHEKDAIGLGNEVGSAFRASAS
jgi:hypothetical protein